MYFYTVIRNLQTLMRYIYVLFCTSYKCVFKHAQRGIIVIVLGMRVVLG